MQNTEALSQFSFVHGDKRLEAALELAEQEHKNGKPRRGGQPYIEHPLLVAKILDGFGCNNKQIAVGLLHDVIEEKDSNPEKARKKHSLESEDLKREVEKLKLNLIERLNKKCAPCSDLEKQNLALWAEAVSEGVFQLTNGAHLYEGKRTWQVDHAQQISPEFRPVKIIDQAASVIDDILHCKSHNPEDPADPKPLEALKRAKGFAHKGLDVSRACRGNDHNNQFHEFYKRIYSYFIKNYELAQAGDSVAYAARQGKFDVAYTIAAAKSPVRRRQVKAEEVIHYYSTKYPAMEKGLARITVSKKEGVVVGFGVVVSRHEEKNSAANIIAGQLLDKLEDYRNQWVETNAIAESESLPLKKQGLEIHGGIHVRDFTLNPPLSLKVFMGLAAEAGAVDHQFFEGKEGVSEGHFNAQGFSQSGVVLHGR